MIPESTRQVPLLLFLVMDSNKRVTCFVESVPDLVDLDDLED
jgi:hypothetical protein